MITSERFSVLFKIFIKLLIISVIIIVITYILIASRKFPQSTIAILGAAATLVLGIVPAEHALNYVEFEVIFLLVSMMIISHTLGDSGFFKWFSIEIVRIVKGDKKILLFALGLITALSSAFLDNVTTVVIMSPITIKIAESLEINPIPFLISEILFSNIGGTSTLIGDPPNLIIGAHANFSFLKFLQELAPVIIIIFFLSYAILLFLFRKELANNLKVQEKASKLNSKGTIKNKKLAVITLIILSGVISGFILHSFLDLEAYVIAFTGAALVLMFENPSEAIKSVQWTSILFFIGLFIIIGGLIETGFIELVADKILYYTNGNEKATSLMLIWFIGLLSGFIDNIPYATTVVPIVDNFGEAMDLYPIWWSLSLGICLGGNLTLMGASANIIASQISSKLGYNISFIKFMKYSFIIVLVSLLTSTIYIFLKFYT